MGKKNPPTPFSKGLFAWQGSAVCRACLEVRLPRGGGGGVGSIQLGFGVNADRPTNAVGVNLGGRQFFLHLSPAGAFPEDAGSTWSPPGPKVCMTQDHCINVTTRKVLCGVHLVVPKCLP